MRGVNTELLALRERGVCATRLNGDWEMKCQCQSQTEINICVCNLSIKHMCACPIVVADTTYFICDRETVCSCMEQSSSI